MELNHFAIPEMLSLIYEEMDVDTIEERFVNLVAEIFSFDRVGLFFVKHRRGVLQGKLCKGFTPGAISSLEIPIAGDSLFAKPLLSGYPFWESTGETDPFVQALGLTNFALIPIINNKRIACWDIKQCGEQQCPAYDKKWVRCWLLSQTKCCSATPQGTSDKICGQCPVFLRYDSRATEGVMLVDNSLSGQPIEKETVMLLSIIAHSVGMAINHSKAFTNVLQESIRDELTGLHNRRYFNERLVDELERAKRYDSRFSLLFADIDHFKAVNDTLGHQVGDAVLASLGRLFHRHLRHSDVVARYGGEEFAMLLLDTDKEKAVAIADHLRAAIAMEPVAHGEPPVKITVSFGVATHNEDGHSLEGLLGKADKALYCAKAQGRNRVCSA
ncbi:MAG: GGDEF domain-containing protein [Deltaproteobacteria bacterium]|nr:GGDEF domain-containing protein [Deltaproteobacteria bacterium]